MIGQVRAQVQVGDVACAVVSADLVLDETRAPFASLDARVPAGSGADAADPLAVVPPVVRVTHELRRQGSRTLADLTADLGPGATLATWTAAWGPYARLSDASTANTTEWDAGHRLTAPVRRHVVMHLRRVQRSDAEAVLTLTAMSGEARLMDYALRTRGPLTSGPTVRDVVRLALGQAVPGARPVFGPTVGRQIVDAAARVWEPGRTAWDWCTPILAAVGYRLWCDPTGTWRVDPVEAITGEPLTLSTAQTVRDVLAMVDRDAPGYADAVVVTYEWTDAAGTRRTQHVTAGNGRKVLAVRVDGAPNGSTEAAQRLAAALRRGRALEVPAVYDPAAAPAAALTLLTADGTLTGTTTGVRWSLPSDEMTVTVRDVQEDA